jgi:hypothetical protein
MRAWCFRRRCEPEPAKLEHAIDSVIDSAIDRTLNRTQNQAICRSNRSFAMNQLTANDLKVRGVAAIESILATQPEATISVRGKDRFVVMDIAHYNYLRECELESALAQSRADMAAGRLVQESAADHMARLETLMAADTH